MPVTIWYLEMLSPGAVCPKRIDEPKFRILEATVPQWEFNRFLYLTVGRDWAWNDKRGWNDDQWRAHVESDRLRTFVGYYDGAPAGYF